MATHMATQPARHTSVSRRHVVWGMRGVLESPPPSPHGEQVAMTINFHIRIENAINRSSVRHRPTSSCGVHPRPPAVQYGWNRQVCWWTTHSLGPCHFQTVAAVSSTVHGAFLDENGWLWTIHMGPNMGPPFGRRTAEKRLELKIYMG
jgi:hypothetical protein